MTGAIKEQALSAFDDEEYVELNGRKGIYTLNEVVLLLQNAGIKVKIIMYDSLKSSTVVHNAGGG